MFHISRITHHASLFLYLAILSTIPLSAYASFERLSLNPRVSAMGETYSCSFNSGRNPAINPPSRHIFSAVYSQPYTISEISESQITYGQRIFQTVHFALSWHRISLTGYGEELFSFCLSYSIKNWKAGITVNRFRLNIENFGVCSRTGANLGLHWNISENLQAGLALSEINRPKLPHKLPMKLSGGISVKASPELLLSADIQKNSERKPQVKIGGEYELYHSLLIRAGVSNRQWQVSAGLGIKFMSYGIDYAWLNHPTLQATHQIAANIFW